MGACRAEVRRSFISTTVRDEYHKGATGRVRTGDQRLPVLCHCQLGQDIPRKRATGPVTAEKATATAAAERAGLCATGRQRRGGQGATPRMREAAKWNSIPPGVSESAQETRAAAVLIQGKGSPEAFLFSVMLRSVAGDGRASHHRADNELNTEYAQRQVKVWSISCFKAGMVAEASVGGRNAPRSSSGLPHGPVEVKRVVI